MSADRLFIIDAMAMLFRSFYAFGKRPLTTKQGLPTSAIYGSAQFIINLIEKENPEHLVIACDAKHPTFRHELYPEYKANRSAMPEDLAVQIPEFERLISALGCPFFRQPGFEADDLIGSLAKQFASPKKHVYIVSGDKDFYQLVDENISLYSPKRGGEIDIVTPEKVIKKWDSPASKFVDILAIMGDSSDNVPGVRGIGEKGAAKLVAEHGSLESIYENPESIKNKSHIQKLIDSKENAFLSKKLVTIKTDIELDLNIPTFKNADFFQNAELKALFTDWEFNSLADKFVESFSLEQQIVSSTPNKKPQDSTTPKTANDSHVEIPKNYQLVNNKILLENLCEKLTSVDLFCFDTETTGLDIISDHPIGIAISTRPNEGYYIPLIAKHLEDIDADFIKQKISSFFADSAISKVAHNLKFDYQMLKNFGISIDGPCFDTMVEHHLIDSTARSHSLDYCCEKILSYQKIPTSELIGKKAEISMADVPLDKLTTYACEDVDYTLQLHRKLYPQLESENLLSAFHLVEMPLIPIIAEMERSGIHLNLHQLEGLSEELAERIESLKEEIYEIAGHEFNIASPKQLGSVLFEELKIHEQLGIKKIKKTKTGYSTDESVLTTLAEHPIAQKILDFRNHSKLKNTYTDTLPKMVNPSSGRIHASFHQTGTATGRLSSSEPNLQNIPIRSEFGKKIREAFDVKSSDHVLISADYSQIELRMLAHLSQDQNLISAYVDNLDIHAHTANALFGEGDTDGRSKAKAINFGIIYGMGPTRLAKETGSTMDEAKQFIEKYFAAYPKIRDFIDHIRENCDNEKYAYTLTGRRRPLPDQSSMGGRGFQLKENIAINSPIQGSAADLIKLAMISVCNDFAKRKVDAKLILQVHDELVFEVHKDNLEVALDIIKESMENAMKLTVPLKVEIGHGNNWLEAH